MAARLAVHRRNAKRSAGPRTARGKAFSGMNSLAARSRSPHFCAPFFALPDASPGVSVDRVPEMFLTSEPASHPTFAELTDLVHDVER